MKEMENIAHLLGEVVPQRTFLMLPTSDSEPIVVIYGNLIAEVQQITEDQFWFAIRHRNIAGQVEQGNASTLNGALRRVMISVEASRLLEQLKAA